MIGKHKEAGPAIAAGVESVTGASCVMKDTKEVGQEDFLRADGPEAGSPVYFGSMAAELERGLRHVRSRPEEDGRQGGGAFATSGDLSGGKETTMMSIIQALLIYGMIVVGDPLDATGHYGVSCTGAPDEKTVENAGKLGKRVATLALALKKRQA